MTEIQVQPMDAGSSSGRQLPLFNPGLQIPEAHLLAGRDDLGPGLVIDRDAFALAPRARLALGLAGHADMVESGRGGALLQPIDEPQGLLLEPVLRTELA